MTEPNPEQPQPVVRYWLGPGAALSREETAGTTPQPPLPGAVEITEAEYNQRVAAAEAALEAQRQAQREAELQNLADDLAALTAAGIPDATARRMLGITPDMELPPPSGSTT